MRSPFGRLRLCSPLAIIAAFVALASCTTADPPRKPQRQTAGQPLGSCAISSRDQDWLLDAISGWDRALAEVKPGNYPHDFEVIIFDKACQLISEDALSADLGSWSAEPHSGFISLPTGVEIPAQVTSFAAPTSRGAVFVMAAPSVWRSNGVQGGDLTLEQLTTAVLLHEASHALQFSTYGARISRLVAEHHLPDNFSDDSIQERFGTDESFAASVDQEIGLLMAASKASQREEALRLVSLSRSLAKARHRRFFKGELLYLAEAEEVWLTLEGSGQWLGYEWLVDPRGGGLSAEVADRGFGLRGKWWSQKQGFASFAALHRLEPGQWERRIFGDGKQTIGDLLDEAVTNGTD